MVFVMAATHSAHHIYMHVQGFGSQGCEDISEVILTVSCNAVEKEPVLQGATKMEKE